MHTTTQTGASRRARRGLIAAALPAALAAVALGSADAQAATASMSADGTLNHRALAGERNSVVAFDESPTTVRLSDNAGLRAGVGCLQVDGKTVRCGLVQKMDIRTGDQPDSYVVQSGKPTTYDAGSGDDVYLWNGSVAKTTTRVDFKGNSGKDIATYNLATHGVIVTKDGVANDGRTLDRRTTVDKDNIRPDVEDLQGSDHNDSLNGSNASATERIAGGAGSDALSGNGGPDVFFGFGIADGADFINGGSGTDMVDYAGRPNRITATLDSGTQNDGEAGEGDDLRAIEEVRGTRHNDFMTAVPSQTTGVRFFGEAGSDILLGGAGNDLLDGGADPDTLSAKNGIDRLEGADGSLDTLDCGDQVDTVVRDSAEQSVALCENVTIR